MPIKTLRLANITADPAVQPRASGTSPTIVAEYAAAMEAGAEFPMMVVYEDTDCNWLSEGFTRYAAYLKTGTEKVPCEVRKGDRRAAIINACGSNTTHGQRRTNADKRRAVELVLKEYPGWSSRKIAEVAMVSHTFVDELRQIEEPAGLTQKAGQLATVASSISENPSETQESTPETRVGVDGKKRPASNPKSPKTEPEEPEADEGGAFVESVETICREIDQLVGRMKLLKSSRFAYSINIDSSVAQVEAARKTLWQGRPAHVCPYCKGDGCQPCAKTGRVKKSTFDAGREAVGGGD